MAVAAASTRRNGDEAFQALGRTAVTRGTAVAAGAVVILALLGAAALLWWPRTAPAPALDVPAEPIAAATPASAAPAAPVASPVAAAPVPASAPEPRAAAAPLTATGIGQAFADLLGAKAVQRWLLLDDFARRFVATLDNLGRSQAPSMLWPIHPVAGRVAVIEHGGRTVIDADNALRYTPFVHWIEEVDSAAAVELYVRLLPLLQQAYEELGFPGRRFHTRLLEVVDHLLDAPESPTLIEVRLTDVKGPIPSLRPWVRYEFADAALESASAGHKLMVRVGTPNQRRLKAKLVELRAELVRRARE